MILIGLGNPGKEYENTFHNMGYGVVDAVAEKVNKKINKIECDSLTAVCEYKGEKLVLAKPLTYMNLSGNAVKSLVSKYGEKAGEIVVVYDDIDLPRFALRVRGSGSAGTHNGMRNIVEKLGSEEFKRIRVGIGRPEHDLRDYVLSRPTAEDEKAFREVFDRAAALLLRYAEDGDFDRLMREGNTAK